MITMYRLDTTVVWYILRCVCACPTPLLGFRAAKEQEFCFCIFCASEQYYEVSKVVITILHLRKLRFRKIRCFAE